MGFDEPLILVIFFSLNLVLGFLAVRNTSEQEARMLLLERKINLILNHLSIKDDTSAGMVQELIMRGQKIQAIKLYREQSGLGLNEAKEAVDQIQANMRAGQ